MKKYFLLAGLASAFALPLTAQSAKRTTAYMALQHYKENKNPAELTKAKTSIDEAMQDAGVAAETKSWVYKGNIYVSVFEYNLNKERDKITDVTDAGKRQQMAYNNMASTSELTDASNSFIKSKGMDAKNSFGDDINVGLANCYSHAFNLGLAYYNNKKYSEAIPVFELSYLIQKTRTSKLDTNSLSNAALCAFYAKNYDKGIELYRTMADNKIGKAKTWISLANLYQEKGDNAGYRKAVSDGLAIYPEDADLLTADINSMLKDNKFQDAIDKLNKLIEKKTDDANLRFVVGNVYDRIANPRDINDQFTAKPANFEEMYGKAVEQYTKASQLKPDYFDAYFNLGILYNNVAAEYSKRSGDITGTDKASTAKRDELDKKTNDALKLAMVPLEKAHEIQPKDLQTMKALKQIYGLLGENEKYDKIKKEMSGN